QAGEVDDHVVPADHIGVDRPDVAAHEAETRVARVAREGLVPEVEAIEDVDLVAGREQLLDEDGADVAGAACAQKPHLPILRVSSRRRSRQPYHRDNRKPASADAKRSRIRVMSSFLHRAPTAFPGKNLFRLGLAANYGINEDGVRAAMDRGVNLFLVT